MKRRLALILLGSSLAIAAGIAVVGFGGHLKRDYAGQDTRIVKALSADRIEGLKAGKGLGYAKSAELGGWPGPLHALELADKLELSREQITRMEELRQEMLAKAKPLGMKMIEAEQALDRIFAKQTPVAGEIEEATQQIAFIEARLRAVHLTTHLVTAPLLNDEQKAIYQRERGYGHGNHAGH